MVSFSSLSSDLGMKSFSATSLTGDLEKEDKIKELENLLETQKCIIEKQNKRISELEVTEKSQIKIDVILEQTENDIFCTEDSKPDDEDDFTIVGGSKKEENQK